MSSCVMLTQRGFTVYSVWKLFMILLIIINHKFGTCVYNCEDGGKCSSVYSQRMAGVLHNIAFNIQRRNKHDIFKTQYQLGEFHRLRNELRKDPTEWLGYCNSMRSAFHFVVQAIRQNISRKTNKFPEKRFEEILWHLGHSDMLHI